VKQITRLTDLDALGDLIEAPPRAYLAYVADGLPDATPVTCRRDADGRWLVALPPDVSLPDDARVALLIDDGDYYFQLRGVRVRGVLRGAMDGARELAPDRVVCWDYGTMRRRAT
jgi:hypothetical protein